MMAKAPAQPGLPASAVGLMPLTEIHDFNQRNRDCWVRAKAATVAEGSRVLDMGAGTCLYRPLFSHCDYKTHDFKKYEGAEKHGGTSAYGHIDYVSEILAIPAPDQSFDVILCTEVLEHVPEPIQVLKEISRLLRPGGRAFITAPLGSGLHQLPFHFYGGYTPEWYKRFCTEAGMEAIEITPNGGFFKHLGQECSRAASIYGQNPKLHGPESADLIKLLVEILPRLFFDLDDKCFDERFTVGYFVEAVKMGNSIRAIH
jgi:SAM-dependent methyltransferase